MNALFSTRLFAALAILSIASNASAFTYWAPIVITRNQELTPNEYSLSVTPTPDSIYHAPDGSTFSAKQIKVVGLSFSDVLSRFSGQWTIEDFKDVPAGSDPQRHVFSLSTSQLSVPFPAFGQILSPADGAIVPPTFNLTWAGDTGLHFRGGPVDVDFLSNNFAKVSVEFAAGETQKTLLVSTSEIDPRRIGLASPDVQFPVNRFNIQLWYQSQSTPHALTVKVPEPSTLALGSFALLSLAALRRRK